jgi:hypothetical protein
MSNHQTIAERIKDWRAVCGYNRIKYKEVIDASGLPYDSVINNMRVNVMSHERMSQLEEALHSIIAERNLQPAKA